MAVQLSRGLPYQSDLDPGVPCDGLEFPEGQRSCGSAPGALQPGCTAEDGRDLFLVVCPFADLLRRGLGRLWGGGT